MLRPKVFDRLINIYILRLRKVVRVTIKQKKCDYDTLLFVKHIMIKKIEGSSTIPRKRFECSTVYWGQMIQKTEPEETVFNDKTYQTEGAF